MTTSYDDAVSTPWPPPSSPPVTRTGWYRAVDGEWYVSAVPPAPGYVLTDDGHWQSPDGRDDEPWRRSTWGLGDFWWGVLVYLLASLVLGVVIAVVATAVDSDRDIDDLLSGPYVVAALVVVNAIAFAGVPWLASRRKGLASLAADFGLRFRPIDLAIGLGLGIGGLIGAAVVSTVVDSLLDVDESTSNVPVDALGNASEFVVFFVAVAVVTPIVEELFFRGLLYRSFLKRGSRPLGAIVRTTIIFVIPHLTAVSTWQNVVTLAATIGVLGAVFNLACHVTGNRLGAPIVAHLVVNGTAAVALFVT